MAVGTFSAVGQDVEENKLKLEVEPGLYFNSGRSILGMYNVTKDNNLGIGLYLMTTNIPEQIYSNMLTNVSDSTTVSVSTEVALNVRYRFKLSKNMESNPYVGMILGWENIWLRKDGMEDLNISTMLITPHVGYEFYLYKKMLYVNPQIRYVLYMGTSYDVSNRPEKLNSSAFVPSVSLGFRL